MATGRLGCTGRYRSTGQRCGRTQSSVGVDTEDERRVASQSLRKTDRFPLEELTGADSHRCSSITEDIPRNAKARRDAVIILLNKGIVGTRRPS